MIVKNVLKDDSDEYPSLLVQYHSSKMRLISYE